MEWERDIEAEEVLRGVERKEDLRLALSHLNPLQIAMVLLRVHHGFNIKDAGRICGIDLLQAQTLYEDAVQTLRSRLSL
ncbi:MAG: hypothetical protein KatS3mg023_0603 [Armatimonadota bacterium]|nr:MAG: hypothetical protein KatS3mg023_0603 [Armatimonadota bacterium]